MTLPATDALPPAAATPDGAGLGNIRLLASVPVERLDALAGRCRWVACKPNDVVFELDDPSTDVYFIVRGKLRIVILSHDGSEAAEGDAPAPVTLAELTSGETFGELAAVDGRRRSARAVALDNGLLAIMPREDFLALVDSCPGVARALLLRFADFIRSLNRRVHSLSTLTPMQRVFMELVRLAEPAVSGDGTWHITPLPPHGDIAGWSGTDRDTVATAIGQLAREGLVERRHKTLLIRDHARLRVLAHL